MALIWATVQEVRDYLADELPSADDYPDAAVQRDIDKVVRTLERMIIRWPALDEQGVRATDQAVRGHMVAAVAETIKRRRVDKAFEDSLGGLAPVLAAGGTISTGKLSASTVGRSGTQPGAAIGDGAVRLPMDAIEALAAAGLIGGGVASW